MNEIEISAADEAARLALLNKIATAKDGLEITETAPIHAEQNPPLAPEPIALPCGALVIPSYLQPQHKLDCPRIPPSDVELAAIAFGGATGAIQRGGIAKRVWAIEQEAAKEMVVERPSETLEMNDSEKALAQELLNLKELRK